MLAETTQQTLPAAPTCGPMPLQYRDTHRALWPDPSGQGWAAHPQHVEPYAASRHTPLPNILEARVPLPSTLNVGEWRIALADHCDTTLVDHIEFGFPSNYSMAHVPMPTFTNHKEDPAYAHHAEYVETEHHEGPLLGPFDVPPFTPWAQCRPIMTQPKSMSVKAGIPRREYLRIPHSYQLPSVATGPQCLHLERRCLQGLVPALGGRLSPNPSSASWSTGGAMLTLRCPSAAGAPARPASASWAWSPGS